MIRVAEYQTQDNGQPITLRFASMSVAEGEAYIEEGDRLLKDPATGVKEWKERGLRTVVASLQKANPGENWTLDTVKTQLDWAQINELSDKILVFSGLKPAGEAIAVPVLPKSVAASSQ